MKQLDLKVFKTLKKQIWALSLQDFVIITVRDNKNQFADFFFWISTIETDVELRIAFSTSKSEINELWGHKNESESIEDFNKRISNSCCQQVKLIVTKVPSLIWVCGQMVKQPVSAPPRLPTGKSTTRLGPRNFQLLLMGF